MTGVTGCPGGTRPQTPAPPTAATPGDWSASTCSATVEQASIGPDPYRVDADGAPYVPVGDGGIVLGVRLGDGGVGRTVGDHAAPGACLVHADPAAGTRWPPRPASATWPRSGRAPRPARPGR